MRALTLWPACADYDLRTYTLSGENWDREVTFTMTVLARSAGDAIAQATRFRKENNKIPAHRWRTSPAH